MKKLLFVVGAVLFAATFITGDLYAYIYAHSTSFTRTMSRGATVSSVDCVYYNPVGLVKLKDGMYIDLGNQGGIKRYEHRLFGQGVHDTKPVYMIPNLGLAYKNGRGAIFLSVYVPAGGGSVDYMKGEGIGLLALSGLLPSQTPIPNQVRASNFWAQGAAGGAFSLTDWLALTAGMKVSMFSYEESIGYKDVGTISKKKTSATGFSGFAGILITPMEKINFAALYSSHVIARGKTTDLKWHYSYIAEERLPDYLLMGLNIKPTDTVEIQLSYQINFGQQKNYGTRNIFDTTTGTPLYNFVYGTYAIKVDPATGRTTVTPNLGGNIQDHKFHISHKVGIGGEFLVHKMLLLSLGVSYESDEKYPAAQNPLDPSLKNWGVGLGGKLIITEQISLELAAARYFYIPARTQFNMIKMNKSVTNFGLGLTAKVM